MRPTGDDWSADIRSYYEKEARSRLRQPLRGPRVELREAFIELLRSEGRDTVVDFGAGPGRDGLGFVAAGCRFVGIDVAHGNATLAAEAEITVLQASIIAPPFRSYSFDAGWSMSTLMHLQEYVVGDALAAMTATLRPEAPLLVGVWGGTRRDILGDSTIEGEKRRFSLRPFQRNRELLSSAGTIEWAELWDAGPDDWEYHVFQVRTPRS